MYKELVKNCRSYRRFYEDEAVPESLLRGLVDLTRFAASASNAQALKYRIVHKKEERQLVYETLMWARAIKDWSGPKEGERPGGYIIILCDKTLGKNRLWDEGIAAQTMMLGAVEAGFGGCMLGSARRSQLAQSLGIDPLRFTIGIVLALGRPKEEVVIVPVPESGDVSYYRDENQVHYVPKRSLEDILV